MFIWILIVLVGAATVCFFVDLVKGQSWIAGGLFLLSLAFFVNLLNMAV